MLQNSYNFNIYLVKSLFKALYYTFSKKAAKNHVFFRAKVSLFWC